MNLPLIPDLNLTIDVVDLVSDLNLNSNPSVISNPNIDVDHVNLVLDLNLNPKFSKYEAQLEEDSQTSRELNFNIGIKKNFHIFFFFFFISLFIYILCPIICQNFLYFLFVHISLCPVIYRKFLYFLFVQNLFQFFIFVLFISLPIRNLDILLNSQLKSSVIPIFLCI
ncbi:hypothetical protein Cni_G15566 [Canna indica]|uniref:Transmembrane protein n=1 Tax=Canna indica TaxID=4628 RepID=A0AAQ3KEB3_9LILI|nr:hypothetical protein Cni_G15566 [Canna indica]